MEGGSLDGSSEARNWIVTCCRDTKISASSATVTNATVPLKLYLALDAPLAHALASEIGRWSHAAAC